MCPPAGSRRHANKKSPLLSSTCERSREAYGQAFCLLPPPHHRHHHTFPCAPRTLTKPLTSHELYGVWHMEAGGGLHGWALALCRAASANKAFSHRRARKPGSLKEPVSPGGIGGVYTCMCVSFLIFLNPGYSFQRELAVGPGVPGDGTWRLSPDCLVTMRIKNNSLLWSVTSIVWCQLSQALTKETHTRTHKHKHTRTQTQKLAKPDDTLLNIPWLKYHALLAPTCYQYSGKFGHEIIFLWGKMAHESFCSGWYVCGYSLCSCFMLEKSGGSGVNYLSHRL